MCTRASDTEAYIYIYIQTEREREREIEQDAWSKGGLRDNIVFLSVSDSTWNLIGCLV